VAVIGRRRAFLVVIILIYPSSYSYLTCGPAETFPARRWVGYHTLREWSHYSPLGL
jgi:hypothetical protein